MIRLKRFALFLALCLALPLCGCAPGYARYTTTFFDTFDTVFTLIAYAPSRARFDEAANSVKALLDRLHAVFDKYEAHDGVAGVWALNHAGGEAVAVEPELMALLIETAARARETGGRVNIAMGAVLELWSEYRSEGVRLPPMDALLAADAHSAMDNLILDAEAGTARLLDPDARLDLGAVAKGYAVEKAAELLAEELPSFLIDGGGNIRTGDPPMENRDAWVVGVTDPISARDGEQGYLMKLKLNHGSAVTSGGYQRYYLVDGARYHHLIDPDTLMPATFFEQVTIVAEDSGVADFLSTTVFLMPYDEGRALVDGMDGVEAVWVRADGTIEMTDGMRGYLID